MSEPDDRPDYDCPECYGILNLNGNCWNVDCPSHTSMTTPPEQLPVETVALKGMTFEQRMIMLSWSLGLILVPLKLVGYTELSWGETTFPLWGGTLLFISWGLLSRALRGPV